MDTARINNYAKASGDLALLALKVNSDKVVAARPAVVSPSFGASASLAQASRNTKATSALASLTATAKARQEEPVIEVVDNEEIEIRLGGRTISIYVS